VRAGVAGSWRGILQSRTRLALLAAILVYVAVASVLCLDRLEEFYYENWDFGIFQQALWSTTHGRVLYESGDYEIFGLSSFFEVHPSFLMFPLAGLYALAPTPYTLIFLQIGVTAAAALPLYGLVRAFGGSEAKALLSAVMYLAFVPVLSSNLYDFHLESFFPLETFAFAYLWVSGRRAASAVVAVITFATMEIGPFFILFILLFLEWDRLVFLTRNLFQRLRRRAGFGPPGTSTQRFGMFRSDARFLALAASALMAYVILRALQHPPLAHILGLQSPESPGYGFTPSSFGLSLGNLPDYLTLKVEYWFLAYALLAFLPLAYPRTVIMALPWMAGTFLSSYWNYVTLGYQYGYLLAGPLLIGFAYSLSRLDMSSWRFREVSSPNRPGGGARRFARLVVISLVVVLAANLLLSPADPFVQYHENPDVGPPGYWATYQPGPGYSSVTQLAALIPPQSSLVVSDDLFPLFANHVQAYSTLWYPTNPPNLPFNQSHLPDYVVVSGAELPEIPTFLLSDLYNSSVYGIRATVGVTPVGAVTLFEKAYSGPVLDLAPLTPEKTYYYGDLLDVGSGEIVANSTAPFNVSIDSTPPDGEIPSPPAGLLNPPVDLWYGPYATMPAGSYEVTLLLHVETTRPLPLTTPALFVDSSGFATGFFLHQEIPLGTLQGPGWHPLNLTLDLPALVYKLEVRGYLVSSYVSVQLAALVITPESVA
jgi:uncharacterized membrane protein